jgi:Ecdysteroid kinase-like family
MPDVLTDISQITPDWLTSVLRIQGYLDRGQVTTIGTRVLDVPGSSTKLYLDVQYSSEAPRSAPHRLFLKLSSPDLANILPSAGQKEVLFYKTIATDSDRLPVAHCYDAVYAPHTRRYHILLEDLSTSHEAVPGTIMPPLRPHCEHMVDALARLHAYWWDHPRLGVDIGHLPTEESEREQLHWAEITFPRFAHVLGDRLSQKRRTLFERLFAEWPRLTERLTKGKQLTLVLGDVHSGQFLFPRDGVNDTVRIVDWDWWDISVGPMDLAYTISLFWFPERRSLLEQSLLQRYHDRLMEDGVTGYDRQACWYDYRFAVIRNLLVPMQQWSTRPWPDFWYLHLERSLLAFEDLGCEELLE